MSTPRRSPASRVSHPAVPVPESESGPRWSAATSWARRGLAARIRPTMKASKVPMGTGTLRGPLSFLSVHVGRAAHPVPLRFPYSIALAGRLRPYCGSVSNRLYCGSALPAVETCFFHPYQHFHRLWSCALMPDFSCAPVLSEMSIRSLYHAVTFADRADKTARVCISYPTVQSVPGFLITPCVTPAVPGKLVTLNPFGFQRGVRRKSFGVGWVAGAIDPHAAAALPCSGRERRCVPGNWRKIRLLGLSRHDNNL